MKKIWNIVSNVLIWMVVAVTVIVMVFTIVSVNTFDRSDRDLFGYRFFIVLSDSMSATDFDAGDVVVVKRVDPTTLKEGDIIAFTSQNPDNYGVTVTHKIRRLTVTQDGERGFVTYGTTTNTDDETVVTYPFVQGQYRFRLPMVGTFFQFLRTTQGYIICILIPFLLLILYQGLNTVKIFRQYKAEQMAELQAEREAVEVERKRSEAMMAEILAMKAQITAGAVPQPPAAQAAAETLTVQESSQNIDVAAMLEELQALKAQLAATQTDKTDKVEAME